MTQVLSFPNALPSQELVTEGGLTFQHMQAAFKKAQLAVSTDLCTFRFTLAGQAAQMRTAGRRLAEKIQQPLSHLSTEEQGTAGLQLKIDLWDESVTGIACPVETRDCFRLASLNPWVIEFGATTGSPQSRFLDCYRPGMITCFDRKDQHIIGWVANGTELSLYERGKPLLFPLLIWHSDQNIPVIHAALVSHNKRGVLFAGKGETGKTTSALACLQAGFDYPFEYLFEYLGDDYIGLQAADDTSFVGHSVYNSSWLMAEHLSRFSGFIPHAQYAENPRQEKTLLPLAECCADQLGCTASIRLIVLPRLVSGDACHVRSASKRDALFALAPSSVLLRPGANASTLRRLKELVESTPCYWLELGQRTEEIPVHIAHLLEKHSKEGSLGSM